jgi:hypothetical protein
VSLLSTLVAELGFQGSAWLVNRVAAPVIARAERRAVAQIDRWKALEADRHDVLKTAGGNPWRALKALREFYPQNGIKLWPLVVMRIARPTARLAFPLVLARPGQNTVERLLGAIWIVEAKGEPTTAGSD